MADEVAQARELAMRIDQVLAKLPQSQRAAFELVKNEGLSMAEAAQVLGTTVAAVKLRAHRAYEALRGALGDVLGGMEAPLPQRLEDRQVMSTTRRRPSCAPASSPR